MSLAEASPTAKATASRCLLCSVGCPVRVRRVGPDQYLPDYVPQAGYVGLCGRGSVLVELLDHEERFRRAGGPAGRPIPLQQACREMAETIRRSASAVIVADGNLGLDVLARIGRFAREVEARWAVHVPPGDAGLVRGLDGSGANVVAPEALAQADALLVVGDVFAAAPVAAHWIFAAGDAHSRMPRLVMAGGDTATAKFATSPFEPALASGGFGAALAAVRTGLTGGLPGDATPLVEWKHVLGSARHPAIVLTAELGFADGCAAAREAAALAKETGAMVCPLTAFGNAWGAMRVADAEGAGPVATVLRPGADAVLVIGCDPATAYGSALGSGVLDAAGNVLYVGPMPNRTSGRASLVIPSAFGFETAGRALLGPDRLVTYEPLLDPPAGVPTVDAVLDMAGAPGEGQADIAAPATAPEAAELVGAGAGDCKGIAVAPASDAVHFDDGSVTGRAAWPRTVRPRPVLALAPSDAEAAGLSDGRTARLTGPGGSAEAEVVVRPHQRAGQAWVSRGFAEVRDAFGWSWAGPCPGEPVCMEIEKA